jgi:hypothetical protein
MESSNTRTMGIARWSGMRTLVLFGARESHKCQPVVLRLLQVTATVLLLAVMASVVARAGNVAGYAGFDTPSAEISPRVAGAGPQELATGTVIVNLHPSHSAVAKDDIFTVDIQIVAGSQLVDGAELHLSFHRTYLQVVDNAGNPTSSIQAGSAFSFTLVNTVDTSTELADIYFAACSSPEPGMPRPSGTFTVATVRFKALSGTGAASTPLTFTQAEVTYGGDSVLGTVENGSVTISVETPTVTPTLPLRRVFLPVVMRQR